MKVPDSRGDRITTLFVESCRSTPPTRAIDGGLWADRERAKAGFARTHAEAHFLYYTTSPSLRRVWVDGSRKLPSVAVSFLPQIMGRSVALLLENIPPHRGWSAQIWFRLRTPRQAGPTKERQEHMAHSRDLHIHSARLT